MRARIAADPTAPHHFFCSSGGNAGLACVVAARAFRRPCTIVVPLSTPPLMVAKLEAAGAGRVVRVGASWADADRHLRDVEMPAAPGAAYVPPFDDPLVWAGNATLVDEVHAQLRAADADGGRPDAIVTSVGGGGLFCGIMEGLERHYPGALPQVLAVETEGADSLSASLHAGEHVTLPGITSIAKSLGAVRVASRTYKQASGRPDVVRSVMLSDAEAAMGCWRLADDERLLVEPACGASVALCYGGRLRRHLPDLTEASTVVVVVCGGSNVTLEMLVEYRAKYGGDERVVHDARKERKALGGMVPSQVTAPANGVA